MGIQRIFGKNADYQRFEVLQTNRNKRHKYNEFLVEGVRNINEAVRNSWQVNAFLYASGRQRSSWGDDLIRNVRTSVNYELTDSLMRDLSKKEDTSELLAIIQMRDDGDITSRFSENPIIALFDRPSNKGNLGTMLRSCDALGVEGIIITGHGVDVYDPDVISSSMGSFFSVPFARLADNAAIDRLVNKLRARYPRIKVVGTTAHRQTRLRDVDLTTPVLFLIGNETEGLNRHLAAICDYNATIPMDSRSSASSFNVSCAATVMFYEANRQRSL